MFFVDNPVTWSLIFNVCIQVGKYFSTNFNQRIPDGVHIYVRSTESVVKTYHSFIHFYFLCHSLSSWVHSTEVDDQNFQGIPEFNISHKTRAFRWSFTITFQEDLVYPLCSFQQLYWMEYTQTSFLMEAAWVGRNIIEERYFICHIDVVYTDYKSELLEMDSCMVDKL